MGWTEIVNGTLPDADEPRVNMQIMLTRLMNSVDDTAVMHALPFSLSSGTATLTRGLPYYFPSFSLTGGTLTISGTGDEPLIIFVDGNVTFSGGTIDLSEKGYAGGTGGATNGTAGTHGSEYTVDFHTYFRGKGYGGGSAEVGDQQPGTATTYTTLTSTAYEPDDFFNVFNVACGAGGGGGEAGSGANFGAGGAGGAGGASIIFICRGDFTGTGGTIDASGADGSDGANGGGSPGAGGGGGGGGAGGTIIIAYTGTYNAPTLVVSGGAASSGGSGAGTVNGAGAGAAGGSGETSGDAGGAIDDDTGGTGGAGGNGVSYVFQIT